MEVTAVPGSNVPVPRRAHRLPWILAIGLLAIVVSLMVRNSSWARERRLKQMDLEELALAIHDAPNDPLTFLYYGSALMEAKNYTAAENAFQRAVDLDPRSARARIGLGSAQLRAGKVPEARDTFEVAVRQAPKDPAAHFGLAQAYYQMGSPRRALPSLQKLTELQPNSALAWYQLGKAYGDARQADQALLALEKATQVDPKLSIAWRDLGQLYRHYSRIPEAEAAFTRAIQLQKEDPVAYYWLGQLYSEMADDPKTRGKAEQCFLAALARDPKMAEGYYELGRLYERAGNYRAAIPRYRKSVELDPSNDKPLYHLGRCLVQVGERAEGQKLMKASQELRAARFEVDNLENRLRNDPNNRQLHLRLGRVYRRYGNFEGALQQYDLYQRLGPRDPAIDKEAVAYIKELQKQGLLPR
ncbi:MAG: tetratricopeptide repeat protein [Chloroherpetonaceae bacterium]|nr:tetratricopeptide repeat protein [Chloroherpetonaceae bacterium]